MPTDKPAPAEAAPSTEQLWDEHWQDATLERDRILDSPHTTAAYAVLRRFVPSAARSILEAGCGTGRFCYLLARDLPDASVVGLDSSRNALAHAREMFPLPNLSFAGGDLFRLPWSDATWDVVFNEGVIEHFPLGDERSYLAAVREMARVTRDGGRVVIAVPNLLCLPHTVWKAAVGQKYEYAYEKSFRPDALRRVMQMAGLRHAGWRGFAPLHGLVRYRLRFPRLARPLARWRRRYAAAPEWLRRIADVFGYEFFMCGVKV